ncbi:hypothetical protein NLN82_25580 [Citrobacter portucalensis]|uniref:hypothetical protein n=1 Tax=Citrobacter portucalensis TaxID=1639133 RepID=UPI00226B41F6|nr:hypothetical protein [Citrobacter portucalensis]MCX9039382.1 hypothetical protein [Citrobacter portucalensis]
MMIESVKAILRDKGEQTCLQLVSTTGKSAQDLIVVLREAVETGKLQERNGFYDIFRVKTAMTSRRSFSWVEGTVLPKWVMSLASGPRTCETVFVLAEVDIKKQRQGWPRFVPALIDIRLGHIQCSSTSHIISAHVLRYLPVDTAGAS